MDKLWKKTTFVNNDEPALSADLLNEKESVLDEIDTRVVELESKKAEQKEVDSVKELISIMNTSLSILETESGHSLELNIDENYIMKISLLNKSGVTISSKIIDFPIESMVVNASYNSGKLTLILQNGNTVDVDVSSIVRGLVNESRTIAGIDLKDDITADELIAALGIDTIKEDVAQLKGDIDELANNKADKTDISTPYNFKGAITYSDLPMTDNAVNDTYYVTDKVCKYTWNGASWYQSGLNESEYEEELGKLHKDIFYTNVVTVGMIANNENVAEENTNILKSLLVTNSYLYIPNGVYYLNDVGFDIPSDITIEFAPNAKFIITNFTDYMKHIAFYGENVDSVKLVNFHCEGKTAPISRSGADGFLRFDSSSNIELLGITKLKNANRTCVHLLRCDNVRVENITCEQCNADGFYIWQTSNVFIDKCFIYNCGDDALSIHDTYSANEDGSVNTSNAGSGDTKIDNICRNITVNFLLVDGYSEYVNVQSPAIFLGGCDSVDVGTVVCKNRYTCFRVKSGYTANAAQGNHYSNARIGNIRCENIMGTTNSVGLFTISLNNLSSIVKPEDFAGNIGIDNVSAISCGSLGYIGNAGGASYTVNTVVNISKIFAENESSIPFRIGGIKECGINEINGNVSLSLYPNSDDSVLKLGELSIRYLNVQSNVTVFINKLSGNNNSTMIYANGENIALFIPDIIVNDCNNGEANTSAVIFINGTSAKLYSDRIFIKSKVETNAYALFTSKGENVIANAMTLIAKSKDCVKIMKGDSTTLGITDVKNITV